MSGTRLMVPLLAALIIAPVQSALGQANLPKMINWCIGKNNPTPKQMLDGCTAAITSKKFKGAILGSIYHNRALAYMNMNQLDRAEAELRVAKELAPKDPLVYIGLSRYHMMGGRPEQALEAASRAIELNPNATLGYYNRGTTYEGLGEHAKALVDLDSAISRDPKYIPAYLNRAVVKHKLKRYDDALADASKGLSIMKPKDNTAIRAALYAARAVIYSEKKHYGHSLEDMNRAIAINPSDVNLAARAIIYEKLGQPDRGIADLDNLIKKDASNASAWSSRCYLNAIIGKLEQGLADCNTSLKLAPGVANTLDNRGLVFIKLGKYEDAITDYNAALSSSGYQPGGRMTESVAIYLYGRGVAREKKGDTLGGVTDKTQATAVSPDLPEKFAYYLKN